MRIVLLERRAVCGAWVLHWKEGHFVLILFVFHSYWTWLVQVTTWGLWGQSHVLRSLGELQEAVGRTNARLEFENFGQYIFRTISRTGSICAEQAVIWSCLGFRLPTKDRGPQTMSWTGWIRSFYFAASGQFLQDSLGVLGGKFLLEL